MSAENFDTVLLSWLAAAGVSIVNRLVLDVEGPVTVALGPAVDCLTMFM